MLIVLGLYAIVVWLVYFKLKLLNWNRGAKITVSLIGLTIVLLVLGLLNTRTPSGRVTVLAQVIEITPVVGGTVADVPVVANTQVKTGDVLVRIDQEPFQYSVDEAQANYDIARLTVERKRQAYAVNTSTVSLQSLDESESAYDAAKARLNSAKYDLEQTEIRAPSDGVVTRLSVAPGDSARRMSPLMPFIRDDQILLTGVFAQNGSEAMQPGTEVRLVLDRHPGRIFDSVVQTIAPGTASGQIANSGSLLSAADIGSSSEVLAILSWPKDLDRQTTIPGSVGTATVFGENAGAMGVLATVLLYIKSLTAYL